MPWSSVHHGDFQRLRRHLTIALLEAEAMEPRVQLAYARGQIEPALAANISLVRLLIERADRLCRVAFLDGYSDDNHTEWAIYKDTYYTDRQLAEVPLPRPAA